MVWLEAKKPTTCGKLDSVSRWLPHSPSPGWPRARLFRIENCWAFTDMLDASAILPHSCPPPSVAGSTGGLRAQRRPGLLRGGAVAFIWN